MKKRLKRFNLRCPICGKYSLVDLSDDYDYSLYCSGCQISFSHSKEHGRDFEYLKNQLKYTYYQRQRNEAQANFNMLSHAINAIIAEVKNETCRTGEKK